MRTQKKLHYLPMFSADGNTHLTYHIAALSFVVSVLIITSIDISHLPLLFKDGLNYPEN